MQAMDAAQVGALISTIGLAVQTVGAVLVAVMFQMLRGYAHRRDYFVLWGDAWTALAIALVALLGVFGARYGFAPEAFAALGLFVYVTGKVAFFVLLYAGAWNFARGGDHRRARRLALSVAVGYGLFAILLTRDISMLVAMQVPLAVALLGNAAWRFAALDPERRAFGTRVASTTFIAMACIWVMYGVLFFAEPAPGRDGDLSLLDTLAAYNSYADLILQSLLAIAIVLVRMEDAKRETDAAHTELAHAHQRLRDASLRDPLTGAFNRLAFSEGFGLEAARQAFGAVALVDVDDLKRVNDRHGHAAGDALLRAFVKGVEAHLRDGDQLYRMGGDEFLLVFPRADATDLGPRLAQVLEHLPLVVIAEPYAELQPRASWGIAPYTGAASFELAIRKADQRMYERKRARKELALAAATAPAN
jgi:diguanylate cyclase (GGDEF)-like protein